MLTLHFFDLFLSGQPNIVTAPINVVQVTGLKVDAASVMAKSKSLPRGLPSDGSAFNAFDGQNAVRIENIHLPARIQYNFKVYKLSLKEANLMSISLTTSSSKMNAERQAQPITAKGNST